MTRTLALLGGAIRRIAALLVLAALLGGPPVLIVWLGRSPLPTADGTSDSLRGLLTEPFDGTAILGLVTVALGVAWAIVVLSVTAELVALARGIPTHARRAGGPLAIVAHHLVATLLATHTSAAVGAVPPAIATTASPAVVAVVEPAQPTPQPLPTADVPERPSRDTGHHTSDGQDTQVIEVKKGDNAWSLAQAHLGDGMRWRELYDLNRDRRQPDGKAWSDPEHLQPGWQLALPPTTSSSGTRKPNPDSTENKTAPGRGVRVQPDEHFWSIAMAQLQAAWGREPTPAEVTPYWQALVDQNRERLPPPGNPDLIHPGQELVLPPAPSDPAVQVTVPGPDVGEERTAPSGTDEDAEHADTPAGDNDAPAPPKPDTREDDTGGDSPDTAADEEEPAAAPPRDTTGETTSEPDQSTAPPTSATPPSDDDIQAEPEAQRPAGQQADEKHPPPTEAAPTDQREPGAADTSSSSSSDVLERVWRVGLIGGGLALAGLLGLLERRRRAQQRRRSQGQRAPSPRRSLATAETQLRGGTDPADAALVDAALRCAAAGCGAGGLPSLRWVEAKPTGVTLVVTEPEPIRVPDGFTAEGPTRWSTILTVSELNARAGPAAAPAPSLCPVGLLDDGTEVLIDPEASGVVTLTGDPDHIHSTLRSIAVSAATAAWSVRPQVLLVGMSGPLTSLPSTDSVATLSHALERAEAVADRSDRSLRSLGCQTVAQARATGATPDAWDPLVVIAAHSPTVDETRRLRALAHRPGRCVAVICAHTARPTATSEAATDGDGSIGRPMVVERDGQLHIGDADLELRAHVLGEDDTRVAIDLVTDAGRQQPVPAAETIEPEIRRPPAGVDAPPDDQTDDPLADIEVIVRVLSEVTATRRDRDGEDEPLTTDIPRGLETICYLALRDGPVDREDLEAALFPAGDNAARTYHNAVSSARRALGEDLFPLPEARHYHLAERVVTDYGLFCDLVDRANHTEEPKASAELLTDALGWVNGEPFTGPGRAYAWVGPHRGMIVAQVIDAAETLAEIHLDDGAWRAAEWAARQGLRAFPCDERMYRILMRAAAAAGNTPGVERAFRELLHVLADPDQGVEPEDTVHPETLDLLAQLTTHARAGRGVKATRN